MYTPISFSEKLNYQVKSFIFDCADKATENTEKIRFPAYLALFANGITYFALRTLSVAEMTICGCKFICSSDQYMLGKSFLLKQVPLQVLNIIGLPFSIVANSIFIIYEPKHYILANLESVKVELRYAEAGTTDSEDYKNDLYDANSTVKDRLMEWQKRNTGLRANLTSLNNESDTSLAYD
ncbi:hypothetical protein [Candidatus Rhabdochlamydia sp. T3358]|uniref:hypothetical protein n=1 Tax=Candidatus Rhabdochlamydia sp. T3358 TaxID=2099795 RepID=UPI0010BB3081|nr:hypothetical protein [Candidatus Rhabdochlamydia sp. T3358]VHO05316.1 hypothetical protein RHT_01713 [Candidatus Rhabdochlamydia sp. T3358]